MVPFAIAIPTRPAPFPAACRATSPALGPMWAPVVLVEDLLTEPVSIVLKPVETLLTLSLSFDLPSLLKPVDDLLMLVLPFLLIPVGVLDIDTVPALLLSSVFLDTLPSPMDLTVAPSSVVASYKLELSCPIWLFKSLRALSLRALCSRSMVFALRYSFSGLCTASLKVEPTFTAPSKNADVVPVIGSQRLLSRVMGLGFHLVKTYQLLSHEEHYNRGRE